MGDKVSLSPLVGIRKERSYIPAGYTRIIEGSSIETVA